MTAADWQSIALSCAVGLAALVFGLVYFALLRRSVARFVDSGRALPAVGMTLGRIAVATLLLLLIARLGLLPLAAALGGFLLARSLALRGGPR